MKSNPGRTASALLLALLVLAGLGWWQQDLILGLWHRLDHKGTLAVLVDGQWETVDGASRRDWEGVHPLRDRLVLRELEPGLALGQMQLRRMPRPDLVTLWVLSVDPRARRFQVLAEEGFPLRSLREHAERAGAVAAINASFFSDEGPQGLVMRDGKVLVHQGTRRAAHFLVDTEGRPRVVNEKQAELAGVLLGLQGFPAVMSGGVTFPYMRYGNRGFEVHDSARRSALCVDVDGRVLLVAADGLGLTLAELATVLGSLGCWDALGLDGGSSTSFLVRAGGVDAEVTSSTGVPVALGVLR